MKRLLIINYIYRCTVPQEITACMEVRVTAQDHTSYGVVDRVKWPNNGWVAQPELENTIFWLIIQSSTH